MQWKQKTFSCQRLIEPNLITDDRSCQYTSIYIYIYIYIKSIAYFKVMPGMVLK